jgi:hypothetical protein
MFWIKRLIEDLSHPKDGYFVIPDLIRNPVFSIWIPPGVYPALVD